MLSLIHAVAGRPWAIRSELADHVRGLIARDGIAGLRHLAAIKADVHGFDEGARADRAASLNGGGKLGTVAVVQAIGSLTQRPQIIGSAETRSTAQIAAEVRAASQDPNIDGILLEIDSPGGEVFGVPEAWASLRESARAKPVVAWANSVAASAALYLASAATEFWITPSGEAGSVGVYSLHVDISKALENMGEAWDFIVATKSPHKIEGNPTTALSEDARAHLQANVDRYMSMFVRDLAKGRGVSEKHVESSFGGGRMMGAAQAVSVGMADNVGTFEQVVRRAADLSKGGGRTRARAEADPVELAALAALAELK